MKRNVENQRKRKNVGGGGGGKANIRRTRVVDARLKIMARTRSKITDAREILNKIARQTDAREKITKRKGGDNFGSQRAQYTRNAIPTRTIMNRSGPSFGNRRGGDILTRTVHNRCTMVADEVEGWNAGVSVPPLQVHLHNPQPLEVHRGMRSDEESWMRISPRASPMLRRTEGDLKSRLEPAKPSAQEGFRIVVSNLHSSVTHEDIKELFEDIGTLVGSRVVRPGTAEVIYKTMEDAVLAVETYHNRQLDGQPMKCMLVKPSGKSVNTKGSIVPDLHAIHKALFS